MSGGSSRRYPPELREQPTQPGRTEEVWANRGYWSTDGPELLTFPGADQPTQPGRTEEVWANRGYWSTDGPELLTFPGADQPLTC